MTFASLIATWFGAGRLPYGPGTWGSVAALPFAFAIELWGGALALALAAALLFGVGVWAAKAHAAGRDDPGEVVVDEVVGQWLAVALAPAGWLGLALAFVAFRFFDIVKPWPISWLDRHVKGGLGVMADDVAAGLAAGLLVLAAMELWR